jgi:hypothetical protein
MAQVEQSRAALQDRTHHWEADKRKKEEQYHIVMAAIYHRHPLPYDSKQTVHMQDHCKYFADKARDAAVAVEEMASAHERIADQIVQSGHSYGAALMNQRQPLPKPDRRYQC